MMAIGFFEVRINGLVYYSKGNSEDCWSRATERNLNGVEIPTGIEKVLSL